MMLMMYDQKMSTPEDEKPGHINNLDAKQRSALDGMRAMFAAEAALITDPDHPFPLDDYTFLRFLRARQFDLPIASALLRKSLAWRKANNVDDILSNPPARMGYLNDIMDKCLPQRYCDTFDKEGRPIYVNMTGAAYLEAGTKYITQEEINVHHIWNMERHQQLCRQQSKTLGRKVETVTNIVELTGISLASRNSIPWLQAISAIDVDNYPETLGRTVVCQAPRYPLQSHACDSCA
jgi:hypothetical protein